MRAQWRFHFPGERADTLYAIAADVESYPDFLPGCVAARVLSEEPDGRWLVDNVFGKGFFRTRFRSVATPDPPKGLVVTSDDGPWRHLGLDWRFADGEGGAVVELSVAAEFRSPMVEAVAGPAFLSLEGKLIEAFERRLRAARDQTT